MPTFTSPLRGGRNAAAKRKRFGAGIQAEIRQVDLPIEARLALILFTLYTVWSGFHGSQTGVADFAHLGGLLGGWLVYRYWRSTPNSWRRH